MSFHKGSWKLNLANPMIEKWMTLTEATFIHQYPHHEGCDIFSRGPLCTLNLIFQCCRVPGWGDLKRSHNFNTSYCVLLTKTYKNNRWNHMYIFSNLTCKGVLSLKQTWLWNWSFKHPCLPRRSHRSHPHGHLSPGGWWCFAQGFLAWQNSCGNSCGVAQHSAVDNTSWTGRYGQ